MDITGMDKARVLKALFNNSGRTSPVALRLGHAQPGDMTYEEAAAIIKKCEGGEGIMGRGALYFDYLKGRVIKVDLGTNFLDFRLYDRDSGEGAGERAVMEEMTRPGAP